MIAMAFACSPELLIADEPTTALDVTVQAQILALMAEMQKKTETGILLITHDIGVVAESCDRVLVMYAGQIVESGTVEQVLRTPKHPYTQGLLASLPQIGGPRRRLASIPGQPPDLAHLPPGCPFAPRCPRSYARHLPHPRASAHRTCAEPDDALLSLWGMTDVSKEGRKPGRQCKRSSGR